MTNANVLTTNSLGPGKSVNVSTEDGGFLPVAVLPAALSPSGSSPLTPQPPSLTLTQIIDPQNVTHVATSTGANTATVAGSDGNSYTGRVWDRYASLVAAWGTTAPFITRPTHIVWASSATDASDPVVLDVLNSAGTVGVSILGAQTAATPANFAPATVKNRTAGANNALSGTGPTAVGQFLQNVTNPSVAWSLRVTSAANHLISQPFDATTIAGNPTPNEEDTWTDGDTLNLFEPIAIYLVSLRSRDISDAGTGALTVFGCVALDPSGTPGTGVCTVDVSQGVCNFVQARTDTMLHVEGDWPNQPGFFSTNCFHQGNVWVDGSAVFIGGAINAVAGNLQNAAMSSANLEVFLDGDIILTSSPTGGTVQLGALSNGGIGMGFVCLDLGGSVVDLNAGSLVVVAAFYGGQTVYGSTTANADNIDARGTSVIAVDNVAGATGCFTFPLAILGGLQFNGQQGELAFVATSMGTGTWHTNQSSQVGAIDTVIAAHGGLSSVGTTGAAGASITKFANL